MSRPISNCIGDLAQPDIKWFLEKSDMIMVPVASMEQHGSHLPILTDSMQIYEVTKRASALTDVPYTPVIWTGYSPHHLRDVGDGNGTVTLRPSTFLSLVYDVGRSLIHHGWSKIIFMNGHGSNAKIIDPAIRQLRYDTGAFICWAKPYAERDIKFIRDIFENSVEDTPGWHSSEWETSQIMAHNEKLVRMDRAIKERVHTPSWLPPAFAKEDGAADVLFNGQRFLTFPMEHEEFTNSGVIGDPFTATKEKGEKSLDRYAQYMAAALEEMRKVKVEVTNRAFTGKCEW